MSSALQQQQPRHCALFVGFMKKQVPLSSQTLRVLASKLLLLCASRGALRNSYARNALQVYAPDIHHCHQSSVMQCNNNCSWPTSK